MPLHRVNCQLLSLERRERGNLFQNALRKELEFGFKNKRFFFGGGGRTCKSDCSSRLSQGLFIYLVLSEKLQL